MRQGGIKLVLITGARVSTLLQRMAFLPAADAYICENGGRIFYPDNSLPLALPIMEDMEWRTKHNATGGLLASCLQCHPNAFCQHAIHACSVRGVLQHLSCVKMLFCCMPFEQ